MMFKTLVLSLLVAPAAFAQKPAAESAPYVLTAKSANVGQPGIPVKISVIRWSSDDERNKVTLPLDPAAQAAQAAAAPAGRGGRGGGRAQAALDPDDPANADVVQGGRGGRRGRGGRGDAAPVDPIVSFTSGLSAAPTVGFIWTNETVGYSIKYAQRSQMPDGSERLLLVTDRRLGMGGSAWRPATGTPTDYDFTVIDIRIDPKGVGEGKTSLTSKVILDSQTKTIALDSTPAAPAILQNVKH